MWCSFIWPLFLKSLRKTKTMMIRIKNTLIKVGQVLKTKTAMAISAIALIGVITFGCVTPITTQDVSAVANISGMATAQVVNLTDMDQEAKDTIIYVVNDLEGKFVEIQGSVVTSWSDVVNDEIEKLISEGKIKQEYVPMIKTTFLLVGEGLDYMFAKHPAWMDYTNMGISAVNSFISGFKSCIRTTFSAEYYALDDNLEAEYNDMVNYLTKKKATLDD